MPFPLRFACVRNAVLGLWLATAAVPAVEAAAPFRILTLSLGHPVDSAPLAMRLADGPGLLAVGRSGGVWRYSVLSLRDGRIEAAGIIPGEAVFFDTGDLLAKGYDQVCYLSARGLAAFDPMSGLTSSSLRLDTLYRRAPAQGPAHMDFVRDVDGDGSDDVLVPDFEGWILAVRKSTDFERYHLAAAPRASVSDTRVSYTPLRPRIGDRDGDGLSDLMFLRDRTFTSFLQGPAGVFAAPPKTDQVAAPLATEEQRARWERDDGQVDQSELEIEEVEDVRDFNSDGILDLLTEKSISEGVFDRRSELHVYLGRRENGALVYSTLPDGSIGADGVQFDPLVVDVDGDGRQDIVTSSTRLGLTRVVGALFSGRIGVDLDLFLMQADGSYSEEADYATRFKVEFDLKTGLTRYPARAIADFDGDGHADLLLQTDKDQLTLHRGGEGDRIFAADGQQMDLPLPRNGDMVQADDLDDNGMADVLIRYGPADGEGQNRTLRVLLAPGEISARSRPETSRW